MLFRHKAEMVTPDAALPGRTDQTMPVPEHTSCSAHRSPVRGRRASQTAVFGLGCFWGAERKFWQTEGVYSTAVGYAGGYTPNATYEEACSGRTGHAEVVLVVFDPAKVSYEQLLKVFWENHDPTQGMRQGNDMGTQYRSAIYTTDPSQEAAGARPAWRCTRSADGRRLRRRSPPRSRRSTTFYYAEPYHQQYLAKNPNGYCGIGGTGVSCPIGLTA